MAIILVDRRLERDVRRVSFDKHQVALLRLDPVEIDISGHPIVATFDPVVNRIVVAILAAEGVRPVEMDLCRLILQTLEDDKERRITPALRTTREGIVHEAVIVFAVQLLFNFVDDHVAVERLSFRQHVEVQAVAVCRLNAWNLERGIRNDNGFLFVVHNRRQRRPLP